MVTWDTGKQPAEVRRGTPRRGLPPRSATDAPRVGVRELRQNLSVYLDRVKLGETLMVTEHGSVVAVLAPLQPASVSPLERMVADGRAVPPRHALRALIAPRKAPLPGPPSEAAIGDLRDERLP